MSDNLFYIPEVEVKDFTPLILDALRWIRSNGNEWGWAPYLQFAMKYGHSPMPEGLVVLDFPNRGSLQGSCRLTGAARMVLDAWEMHNACRAALQKGSTG